jgi:ElaB/YqjD/DUF883 family membrane-anchored ribosome-binding protein
LKKHLLHFGWVFVALVSEAQSSKQDLTQYYIQQSKPCGGMDSILNRKGSWRKTTDAVVFPDKTFPRNQYSQLNSRIDQILPLFKEACPDLSGFEPKWYREFDGNSYMPNGPVPYEFSSLYLTYLCNSNTRKIELGSETGTWAYVFINHLNWFCDKVDDWNINDDGKMIAVYGLPPKIGQWKGTTLYAPATHDFAHAVIVGHNGKLPWHTLTQKQYLAGLKNKWESEMQKQLAGYDASEEKIKKEIDDASKSSSSQAPAIKKQLEQQLKDFQAKKEDNKSSSRKFYDNEIKYIDDYVANASAETLGQPAIIDPRYNPLKFRGTFGDENSGGEKLIAIGSQYFTKDLPRYVPQFMILYWRWTDDPVSLLFKKEFEENFPLEKLKAMIDK